MRGTCALDGVTGVASAVKVREVPRSTLVFTLLCYLTRDKENTMLPEMLGVTMPLLHD